MPPARGTSGRGARGNPYLIAGGLPWGGGGSGSVFDYMSSSDPMRALSSHYQNAYNQSLAQNQTNYNNILKGFQQTAAAQGAMQQGIAGGYRNVIGLYDNAGKAESRDISDAFARAQGQGMMNLIDSGLGNSTITSSIMRGLTNDEVKEQSRLAQQVAQLQAGARTNLLGYKERAGNARTAQANQQLNWMNSIQAQFPDGNLYAQLAQMAGAAEEAEKQRKWIDAQIQRAGAQSAQATNWGIGGGGPRAADANAYAAEQAARARIGQGGGFNVGGGSGYSQGGPSGGFKMPQQQQYQDPFGSQGIGPGLNAISPGLGGLASAGYNIASQVSTMGNALNSIYPGLGSIFGGLFSAPSTSAGQAPTINTNIGLGGLWGG